MENNNGMVLNSENCRYKQHARNKIFINGENRALSVNTGNIREHEYISKKFDGQMYPIGNHGLHANWLFNAVGLSKFQKSISRLDCHQLGSDGFVSQIMRVSIEFKNKKRQKYIVKMPETTNIKAALEKTLKLKMPEGADDRFIGGLVTFYNRECDFYGMKRISGIRVPDYFYSQKMNPGKQVGAIVMEDLEGMVSVPYYESLNMSQLFSIASQLVNLHVFSIDMPAEWKKKFSFPMEFINTVANMHQVVKTYVDRNPELKKTFSRVEKMYHSRELFVFLHRDSHKALGLDDFLCHGDLWFYNMLWKSTGTGSEMASNELGAIIDWQNLHTGSIAEDFGHMLTFCCDTTTRRLAEQEFLPVYYELLKTKTEEAGKVLNVTLSQFRRAYRRNFIAHALHLPFITSIMLCVQPAKDEITQYNRNKELIDKVIGAWEDALDALHEEFPLFDF
ncbi:hypothetical protein GCK72_024096 [Caenorhabditis remanei]|uniref:CHK kinase-like domain-containing protein n=1 Tax=Caenorhabditis remanei TaxID=31234 RepID=A0A6A5FYV1_CAERE|nr:hypothetical protein GCK72_024096 [Caenorhabditis remanei]KAF1747631.1 hypothetical protein GCK72_024096 [Caenorhabditis remanei]